MAGSLMIIKVKTFYCETYSLNQCYNEFFLPRLPFDLSFTIISSLIFTYLIITRLLYRDYSKVFLTILVLSTLLLFKSEVTRHNLGGIYTAIQSYVIALFLFLYCACAICYNYRSSLPLKAMCFVACIIVCILKLRFDNML